MIEKERIRYLNDNKISDNDFVLYWMQNAQRTEYNHALLYAIKRANDLNKPLIVFFGLTKYKEANTRHYKFMIEGLIEVKEKLERDNIKFIFQHMDRLNDIVKNACLVVVDKGYLRHEKEWRHKLSSSIKVPLVEVETNLIIPIEEVSEKEEYAAYTIRSKINRLLPKYALELEYENINISSLDINIESIPFDTKLDIEILSDSFYKGGYKEAKRRLNNFISNKLSNYDLLRNDPSLNYQSNLSPYLHFGQISPLDIYLKVKDIDKSESFIEELVVRRELSFNFVYYNKDYDNYKSLPNWALDTLDKHRIDKREYIYSLDKFESYKTHDPYWNACQKEMVITGKMHGYMRMYWGKKIIEWTNSPEEAYTIMVYLNNKYNLDGRDPNSYAGIAWCFGKHDRPWTERNIFGMIRYMNNTGLKRKFDIDKYELKWRTYEENI
jgi:deoxyribodipyrimidine photo-lyase